ncbi:MAG: hypothetical protein ACRDZ3_04850 [Acidimicrobiia bacterium]
MDVDERSSGSVRGDLAAALERIGAGLNDLSSQQAEILARMERLVTLNEQMWDHHLQFCGRLIDKVTRTEIELFEAQDDLSTQLESLQVAIDDVSGRRRKA